MTAQITDSFRYNGEEYQLMTNLDALFHPQNWGMEPVMMHTACYRGYYATLAVENERLLLKELRVQTREKVYPDINGVSPEGQHPAAYHNIDLMLDYTGTLTAARGFDRRHYKHMGFHPLEAYKTHLFLTVKSGLVQTARIEQNDTTQQQPDAPGADLRGWIAKRFKRS